jgi:plasmid stabilization system protein ParE
VAFIDLSAEVFDDFDRFLDHLSQFDPDCRPERIVEILHALEILQTSPLIGRPVKGGKRELVIGSGSRGYVALYRYIPGIDTAFVLAVRAQRESGYKARK